MISWRLGVKVGLFLTVLLAGFVPAGALAGSPERPAECDLLDNQTVMSRATQAFEWRLNAHCGLLAPLSPSSLDLSPFPAESLSPELGGDTGINTPGTDTGSSTTQSETSVVAVGKTLCAAWNDSQHYAVGGTAFAGFGNSPDLGATWTDRGGVPTSGGGTDHSYGDPSLAYRASDDTIYYASLSDSGLSLWKSTDGCQTLPYAGVIHSSVDDDKEILTIDNTYGARHGRMYVVWMDFSVSRIALTFSDDASTWSTLQYLSAPADDVMGAWPAVAPNGDLYVAWVRFIGYPTGTRDIKVSRCVPGASSMTCSLVTNPVSGATAAGHSTICGFSSRQTLDGDVRYLDSPQIAVGPDGRVHVVYSFDPDGIGADEANVAYKYSDDQGTTWSSARNPSGDGTTRDQFFPSLAVNENNVVVAAWYDRRGDAANLQFVRNMAGSYDGGTSWPLTGQVSNVASPVPPIRPNFDSIVAQCYMGDYDQIAPATEGFFHVWGDSRNTQNAHADPDVFFDSQLVQMPGKADYNAEGNEEIGVFRNGMWFATYSPDFSGVDLVKAFGSPTPGVDEPQIGEFDCSGSLAKPDGKTDLAILRKPFSTWQMSLSSNGWPSVPDKSVTFGTTAHKRIATRRFDTSGDSCSDIGVFRNGCFKVTESPDYVGVDRTVCFGVGTDEPLSADVNGDGVSDLGLWRPSGAFYWQNSPDFSGPLDIAVSFGTAGDVPILGDVNKDGITDFGVYRPSSSTFFFTYSPDFVGTDLTVVHGVSGDVPIVADVNGDGQADIGTWRNSIARWLFLCSPGYATSCLSQSFGLPGDVPIYGKSGLP